MTPRRARLRCALLLSLGACSSSSAPAAPAPDASPPPVERAWPVMGTMLHVVVWDRDRETAGRIMRAVRTQVVRVDSLMSNYRDDSDVSRVNRAAGTGEWTRVAPETLEVLLASLEYARASDGAFDATVGPVVDVWGFYREAGALPPAAALDSARALVGWRRVEVQPADRLARLPRVGMRLDFGAIAKGYAIDLALDAARRAGAERAMIDLGGNIGVLGEPPGSGPWPLGLRHPREPAAPFALLHVDSGAIATSGDYERYFVHEGVRYAHVVDPRTGWPVRGVASVSVLATDGMSSDALSTTLFVLGVEEGCAAVAGRDGVAAVWVLPPEGAGAAPLRVVVGGPRAAAVEVPGNVDLRSCDAPLSR